MVTESMAGTQGVPWATFLGITGSLGMVTESMEVYPFCHGGSPQNS